MERTVVKYKPGIYQTIYGNAAKYTGSKSAYDLDMAERISLELVDFDIYIRKLDPSEED
jgi:hypothetical protein